jgi:putative transposase
MPRYARQKSQTGIYHIMVRGINRQDIFYDEYDYQRYLDTLHRIKDENNSVLLGYCLMSNHLHLLINEGKADISNMMKRIGTSYAYRFNLKYDRSGHVFQDRFKSESVESDTYLLTVIRYIHNNPVSAGMVSKPEDYSWSSCAGYYQENDCETGLTDTRLILSIFSEDKKQAIEMFKMHHAEIQGEECLDDRVRRRKSNEEVTDEIRTILKGKPITVLQNMERKERNEILQEIKEIQGSSLRQIARITGLGLYLIHQA